MSQRWAIDLGTTNTVVAMEQDGSVRLVDLPGLTRTLPVDQSPLIPSAVHVRDAYKPFLHFFRRRVREVAIGQHALSRNFDGRAPCFAQGFKPVLATQAHRTVLRIGDREEVSARDTAALFLKELLLALKRECHAQPDEVTIPAPVGYYESYRAELQQIAKSLGIRKFRSVDEPVAAALGYSMSIQRESSLLVVDWGGGTLNLAVVRIGPDTAQTGRADVLAKHMVPLGGNDVDHWLAEHFLGSTFTELPEWHRDVIWEAMWIKERVSREGSGEFRWGGLNAAMNRQEMVALLERRGLYRELRIGLGDIQGQLRETTSGAAEVDEVLLCGGSTLLPEVAAVVDEAFPGAVVRHDPRLVFTSVVIGAARFAAGLPVADFIYHDYALAVQNEHTGGVDYELLVPRRTRYPTSRDSIVRYYADYPGMTEVRLRVCEVGRLGQRAVDWKQRVNGARYWAPEREEDRALVIELNPADAALPLRPPGKGSSPRLRVSYGVNNDRWLCVTVEDLVSKQTLRDGEPVVRLR